MISSPTFEVEVGRVELWANPVSADDGLASIGTELSDGLPTASVRAERKPTALLCFDLWNGG